MQIPSDINLIFPASHPVEHLFPSESKIKLPLVQELEHVFSLFFIMHIL